MPFSYEHNYCDAKTESTAVPLCSKKKKHEHIPVEDALSPRFIITWQIACLYIDRC